MKYLTLMGADVCPNNRYTVECGVSVNIRPSEFEDILFLIVL